MQVIDYQPTSPDEDKYKLTQEWAKNFWPISRINDVYTLNSDDPVLLAEINAFNLAYDGLPALKLDRREELKAIASQKGEDVYGINIDDQVFVFVVMLLIDLDDRYVAQPGAAPARLVSLNQIINTFNTKAAAINAYSNGGNQNDLTAQNDLRNLDLTVGWPS